MPATLNCRACHNPARFACSGHASDPGGEGFRRDHVAYCEAHITEMASCNYRDLQTGHQLDRPYTVRGLREYLAGRWAWRNRDGSCVQVLRPVEVQTAAERRNSLSEMLRGVQENPTWVVDEISLNSDVPQYTVRLDGPVRQAYFAVDRQPPVPPSPEEAPMEMYGPLRNIQASSCHACGLLKGVVLAEHYAGRGVVFCRKCAFNSADPRQIKALTSVLVVREHIYGTDLGLREAWMTWWVDQLVQYAIEGHLRYVANWWWRENVAWAVRPDAVQARAITRYMLEQANSFIASGLGAEYTTWLARVAMAGDRVTPACNDCGYTILPAHAALAPFTKRPARDGQPLCQPCADKQIYGKIMAYSKLVHREYNRRMQVDPSSTVTKAEIARQVRTLSETDFTWYSPAVRTGRQEWPCVDSFRTAPRPATSAGITNRILADRVYSLLGTFAGTFRTAEGRDVLGHVALCYNCYWPKADHGVPAASQNRNQVCVCQECNACGLLETPCSCGGCVNVGSCACGNCQTCGQRVPEVCDHQHCAGCCEPCKVGWRFTTQYNYHPPKETFKRFSPSPAFPRHLGFEIEVARCQGNRRNVQALLKKLGWNICRDGSLPEGGAEIRSCPVRGDAVFEHLEALMNVLEEEKTETNTSCGLHIHVEAGDLSSRQLARTSVAWASIERRVFEVLAPARRENTFCQPSFKDLHGKRLDGKKILEDGTTVEMIETEALDPISGQKVRIPARMTFRKVVEGFRDFAIEPNGYHRYHALNYAAYAKHRTLEFRLFEPKLDLKYILACATVATATLEFGKYGLFTNLPKYEAKTRSKSTRLTYEKLLAWWEDQQEQRKAGQEPEARGNWQEGVAE